MDRNGGLSTRNWGYFDEQMKGNLRLQLMSSAERATTKPFLSNGAFLCNYSVSDSALPPNLVREGWINRRETHRIHNTLPMNPSYSALHDAPSATLQMMHPSELPKEEQSQSVEEPSQDQKDVAPLKKRQQGPRPPKEPKPKKPRKVSAPRDGSMKRSVSRAGNGLTGTGLVINGIDLDLSGIPTPVCSCTGTPQQCYRWGIGGWQSACCTTGMSIYPLPMGTKRRGARIAGRKMSLGAFKKVLEKLAGEGYNLSNPIDLKTHWAKHGTNKFVTIR